MLNNTNRADLVSAVYRAMPEGLPPEVIEYWIRNPSKLQEFMSDLRKAPVILQDPYDQDFFGEAL